MVALPLTCFEAHAGTGSSSGSAGNAGAGDFAVIACADAGAGTSAGKKWGVLVVNPDAKTALSVVLKVTDEVYSSLGCSWRCF